MWEDIVGWYIAVVVLILAIAVFQVNETNQEGETDRVIVEECARASESREERIRCIELMKEHL
jgi:hypothetical protein